MTIGLRTVAQVERHVHPLLVAAQRSLGFGLRIIRVEGLRRIVRNVGQVDRQHAVGDQMRHVLLVVDDREWLTPIALTAEQPVAQTVADRSLAHLCLFKPCARGLDRIIDAQAVQRQRVAASPCRVDGGVDDDAVMRDERRLALIVGEVVTGIGKRRDGVDHRKTVFDGEIIVTLVSARHCHDRTRAIVHQHVICGEHRQFRTGDRIVRIHAGEQAGFLTVVVDAVRRGLGFGDLAVGVDRLTRRSVAALPLVAYAIRPLVRHMFEQWMLRRDHGERCAEQRVGSGRVDLHVFDASAGLHFEVHGRAM